MKKPITFLLIVTLLAFYYVYGEKVTIIHVNDSHSALMAGGERTPDLKGTLGGISKFAGFVKKSRESDTATIVLHAGDFSIGDIMYCKYFGVAELTLLNQIGVNAITLGNHEFDLTPELLTGVLSMGLADSKIDILCANGKFDETPDLKNFIKSNTIITANGVKVGVFGVTTPMTESLSLPEPVTFSDGEELVGVIYQNVEFLKSEGCEVIIMLSHLGYPTDLTLSENLIGIDVIIGGHDHYIIDTTVTLGDGKNCSILQAGAFYNYAGKLELDVTDGVVTVQNYHLITLDEEDENDPIIDAMLEAMVTEVESTYGPAFSQEIAVATTTFTEICDNLLEPGFKDTDVANLTTDVFKEFGKTDIGITASGFTANPLYKGPVVGADIYRINGYGFNMDNTLGYKLTKFDIKGSDIWTGISYGLQFIAFTDDFIIQCSENMQYKYNIIIDAGVPFPMGKLEWVKINGVDIDTNKMYSVTANEGIAMFLGQLSIIPENFSYFENSITEYMALMGYAQTVKTLSPRNKGRITDVKSDDIHYSLNTKAFPNPANSTTTFEFEIENDDYYTTYIYNMQGKLIYSSNPEFYQSGINTTNIALSEFPNGNYTYIITNDKQRYIGKLTIQR